MKKRTYCFMALAFVVMTACNKSAPLQVNPSVTSTDTTHIQISAIQADVYENQSTFNPMQFI